MSIVQGNARKRTHHRRSLLHSLDNNFRSLDATGSLSPIKTSVPEVDCRERTTEGLCDNIPAFV
jgi:hypothetical protein